MFVRTSFWNCIWRGKQAMADKKVHVDEVASTIVKMLSDWSQDVADATKRAATETAQDTVKELRDTSPRRESTGGAYAKSWSHKKVAEDRYGVQEVVYNKKYYRLTHLLEYGHANARGGGRTPAHPHIARAEGNAIETFEEKTRQYINDIS